MGDKPISTLSDRVSGQIADDNLMEVTVGTPGSYASTKTTISDLRTQILSVSSDIWDSVYITVNATSGDWDSVYTTVNVTSSDWDSVYTTVNATSGDWDSVYTTVNVTSSDWDSTHTTVSQNSADWFTEYVSGSGTRFGYPEVILDPNELITDGSWSIGFSPSAIEPILDNDDTTHWGEARANSIITVYFDLSGVYEGFIESKMEIRTVTASFGIVGIVMAYKNDDDLLSSSLGSTSWNNTIELQGNDTSNNGTPNCIVQPFVGRYIGLQFDPSPGGSLISELKLYNFNVFARKIEDI